MSVNPSDNCSSGTSSCATVSEPSAETGLDQVDKKLAGLSRQYNIRPSVIKSALSAFINSDEFAYYVNEGLVRHERMKLRPASAHSPVEDDGSSDESSGDEDDEDFDYMDCLDEEGDVDRDELFVNQSEVVDLIVSDVVECKRAGLNIDREHQELLVKVQVKAAICLLCRSHCILSERLRKPAKIRRRERNVYFRCLHRTNEILQSLLGQIQNTVFKLETSHCSHNKFIPCLIPNQRIAKTTQIEPLYLSPNGELPLLALGCERFRHVTPIRSKLRLIRRFLLARQRSEEALNWHVKEMCRQIVEDGPSADNLLWAVHMNGELPLTFLGQLIVFPESVPLLEEYLCKCEDYFSVPEVGEIIAAFKKAMQKRICEREFNEREMKYWALPVHYDSVDRMNTQSEPSLPDIKSTTQQTNIPLLPFSLAPLYPGAKPQPGKLLNVAYGRRNLDGTDQADEIPPKERPPCRWVTK